MKVGQAMRRAVGVLRWIVLLHFTQLQVPAHGCTLIVVGRDATVDGSTLVAHNDDAGGGTADLRLVRVPRMEHALNSFRSVYNLNQGYPRVVTEERGVHYKPVQGQQAMKPLLLIPQIPRTYGYFDQDYGMMNEVQLSIGESTCSAKTIGWANDVPHGFNAFGIGELSKLALERCDSARCAIRLMGDMAVKHGFYSDYSGSPNSPGYGSGAEALGLADKYGETWIFHVLTGAKNSSAIWAAQRVPSDHISVVANGFVIRQLDLNDPDNFMASENVDGLAREMGWWQPERGPFDFTAAYALGVDPQKASPGYSVRAGRRIWRIFDVFAPSMRLDASLGYLPSQATYPVSVKVDEKIHAREIMNILRDHYEGTPFDLTLGLAAGPFRNPVRYDGPTYGVKGGWERAISVFRTVFSLVLQARGDLPDAVGGTAWYAQDSPHGSVYVPFSCAQEEVPTSYLVGCESQFEPKSAWWAFNFVNNWSLLRYDIIHQDVQNEINRLQEQAFEVQRGVQQQKQQHRHAAGNQQGHPKDTFKNTTAIQATYNHFAQQVVADWWSLAWRLVAKFSDGFVVTGEGEKFMQSPGYPKWWLEATEFAQPRSADATVALTGEGKAGLALQREEKDGAPDATTSKKTWVVHRYASTICFVLLGAAVILVVRRHGHGLRQGMKGYRSF